VVPWPTADVSACDRVRSSAPEQPPARLFLMRDGQRHALCATPVPQRTPRWEREALTRGIIPMYGVIAARAEDGSDGQPPFAPGAYLWAAEYGDGLLASRLCGVHQPSISTAPLLSIPPPTLLASFCVYIRRGTPRSSTRPVSYARWGHGGTRQRSTARSDQT
jgi:hypothetical protein